MILIKIDLFGALIISKFIKLLFALRILGRGLTVLENCLLLGNQLIIQYSRISQYLRLIFLGITSKDMLPFPDGDELLRAMEVQEHVVQWL